MELDERALSDKKKGFGIRGFLFEFFDLLVYVLIILSVTYIVLGFVEQRTYVDGNSMYDTLYDGDSVFVDKVSYRFKEPERFDIVIFQYLYTEDTYYIKRVIGLPGETVQVIDGYVYINGELLEDDVYGYETMNESGLAEVPITLGEDEYFVLGDNRNGSTDSRRDSVGRVHRDQIIGKAFMRIWPLKDIKILD